MELSELRKRLDRRIHQYDHASSAVQEERGRLVDARQHVQDVLQAQEILQKTAQTIQHQAHRQVARVVSRCLSAVFDEPYQLRIEFERRRGRTEAEFVYYRDGHRVDPRVTSGGVLDVASLALRLACLVLTKPAPRKFLALDEPFLALSAVNLKKMAVLIEVLSRELGVQFLIATHSDALKIGTVIEL